MYHPITLFPSGTYQKKSRNRIILIRLDILNGPVFTENRLSIVPT